MAPTIRSGRSETAEAVPIASRMAASRRMERMSARLLTESARAESFQAGDRGLPGSERESPTGPVQPSRIALADAASAFAWSARAAICSARARRIQVSEAVAMPWAWLRSAFTARSRTTPSCCFRRRAFSPFIHSIQAASRTASSMRRRMSEESAWAIPTLSRCTILHRTGLPGPGDHLRELRVGQTVRLVVQLHERRHPGAVSVHLDAFGFDPQSPRAGLGMGDQDLLDPSLDDLAILPGRWRCPRDRRSPREECGHPTDLFHFRASPSPKEIVPRAGRSGRVGLDQSRRGLSSGWIGFGPTGRVRIAREVGLDGRRRSRRERRLKTSNGEGRRRSGLGERIGPGSGWRPRPPPAKWGWGSGKRRGAIPARMRSPSGDGNSTRADGTRPAPWDRRNWRPTRDRWRRPAQEGRGTIPSIPSAGVACQSWTPSYAIGPRKAIDCRRAV
jgi:hypothetical protein